MFYYFLFNSTKLFLLIAGGTYFTWLGITPGFF